MNTSPALAIEIRQFYTRTINQFLIALALVTTYFLVEFMPILIKVLNNNSGIDKNYLEQSTSRYIIDFLGGLSLLPYAQTLITAVVWGLVGLGLYTLYFFIMNILIDTRNHIESALVDNRHVSRQEVFSAARNKILFVIGFFMLLLLSISMLFGFWVDLIQVYILSALSAAKLPYFIAGFSLLVVNVYLLIAYAYLIWKNEQSRYALSLTWKM